MGASWLLQRPQVSGEKLKEKMIQRLFDVKISKSRDGHSAKSGVSLLLSGVWCQVE